MTAQQQVQPTAVLAPTVRPARPPWEPLPARLEEHVVPEFNRQMARAEASRRIAALQYRQPPAEATPGTLAQSLARPRRSQRYLVDGLLGTGHNLSVEGGYKAGKSTLLAALVGSLAEARPFLGRHQVSRMTGRIGFWNAEMDPDDADDYLAAEVGPVGQSWVAVAHLRGYAVPFLAPGPGRDWTVAWLRGHQVQLWVIDTWTKLCAWNRVDPLDNAGVARLADAVDEVKALAGVQALVVSTHMPHSARTDPDFERGFGAQTFSGWVDGMWRYVTKEGQRFLSADGRRIALPEHGVVMGTDRRLTAIDGDRQQAGRAMTEFAVMSFVRSNPGASRNQVENGVTGRREIIRVILDDLVARGALSIRKGNRGSSDYFAHDFAPTSPNLAP